VMIGTDCIGSCKFNYHTITATTAPWCFSAKHASLYIRSNSKDGLVRSVLVWRHVYMWTIVSDWVARSVLVWRHMDYCFKLGGSECASVATCGLLFQTGWLRVC
jgi:hypothetical protein